jgi:GT2 family glycosyltransferase
MAALLLITTMDRADPSASPLARSLLAQSVGDWRLAVLGSPGPFADARIVAAGPADTWWPTSHDSVALVDPEIRLEPQAVAQLVAALAERADAAAVYGDELAADGSLGPRSLRPGWSPDSIRCGSDVGELLVVRTSALSDVGVPVDTGVVDRLRIALRLVEADATVLHVPAAVVRAPDRRPSETGRMDATVDAVNDHLQRCRLPAVAVASGESGSVRLEPAFAEPPAVTVVVPTAAARDGTGERLVERCLDSLENVEWPDLEVLLVVGDELECETGDLAFESRHRVRVLHRGPGEFSFARAVNTGALSARGRLVLMLNDDTVARDDVWLGRMAVHAVDPAVGAVGALLLFADDSIQHAGMVMDDARPLHPFVGRRIDEGEIRSFVGHTRTVAAVTGACLMVERRKFLEVGGLSPLLPLSFNDVDLCLKLARHGFRTVMEPSARMTHDEGATRGATIEKWEWDRFVHRWGAVDDPWYHPGYVRPGDPDDPRRDADHIRPAALAGATYRAPVRDTVIRPRVHHSRNPPPGDADG